MSAGNRRDGLPLMERGGRSLDKNQDSPPPSYESTMAASHGSRPYAPLPTSSTEHRDTCVAQTHHTSPPYPTLNIPRPFNSDYNSSDPRNETSSPSAPYPTDESVYIPSLPTSSSGFYNPMNQMPSPSGLGTSQLTGKTTRSSANLQGRFKVPERNETPTISPQYLDVDRGSAGCQYMKFCIAVISLLVVVVGAIYLVHWSTERRRMRMKASEDLYKLRDDFFPDSRYRSAGRYSD